MPKSDILEELRKKEEEDLARIMASHRGLTYLDLSRITIDLDSLKILPEATARDHSMAVIQSVGKKLQVAVTNPERSGVSEVLENLKRNQYEIQLFLISPTSLGKALDKYKEIPRFEEIKAGIIEISGTKMVSFETVSKSLAKLKEAVDIKTQEKTAYKLT